jgi:hypothetical protein
MHAFRVHVIKGQLTCDHSQRADCLGYFFCSGAEGQHDKTSRGENAAWEVAPNSALLYSFDQLWEIFFQQKNITKMK